MTICHQHRHRTERAITRALLRQNLSTTASLAASRNQVDETELLKAARPSGEKGWAPPEQGSSGWGETAAKKISWCFRGAQGMVVRVVGTRMWVRVPCWHHPGEEKQEFKRFKAEFLLEYDPSE